MTWIDEMEDGLTKRLRQLRDSTDSAPSTHTTNRRQERIARLEAQHIEMKEALPEFDRARVQVRQLELQPWMVKLLEQAIADKAIDLQIRIEQVGQSLGMLR
jgi:hypothetical protein